MRVSIRIGLIVLMAGSFGCRRTASPDPAVAARVNGISILRAQVESFFRFRTQDIAQKPAGEAANILKLEILRELIEGEIMAQKAEQLNLKPTDAEVEAEMKGLKGPATDEEFRKTLEQRGVSEADLRREIGRSLTARKVVENQVRAKIQVSEAEINGFFEENRETFNIKEPMYQIGLIAVTTDPAAPVSNLRNDKALNEEMAVRKIQSLESRLQAGEDFQQLAREYSEDPQTAQVGGDLGYQTAGMLDRFGAAFKATILKMKVGDLTPVVRTAEGYWLFKLLGKREPGQHDLKNPEVQRSIREELQNRKQQLLTAAFSEQLHNEARVENFLAREILAAYQQKK